VQREQHHEPFPHHRADLSASDFDGLDASEDAMQDYPIDTR
jgi:hypothetical protein